jgi:hypothetical protein
MMKPIFSAPRGLLAKKPPYGAPCNRCGLCCMATACPLGQYVFKRPEYNGEPCPGLVKDGDDYGCDVVAHPERYASGARVLQFGVERLREAALLLIGAGNGCDARFNGEPRNDSVDQRFAGLKRENAHAKRVWGARPTERSTQ